MTEYIGWLDEDHAPVVDMAQEVVRCRDCKHCDEEHYGAWGRVWHCEKFGDVEPDGYCAWGERKE